MNIYQLLIAFAVVAIMAAVVMPSLLACRKQVIRLNRHARVRPFTFVERLSLPVVRAMSVLRTRTHSLLFGGDNRLALANEILTHPMCGDTALADEAIGRFRLIKAGSNQYHKALCDKGDVPEGFTRDSSASAAEERFAFDWFGLAHKGTEATASGACTAGNLCCPGDDGTIRDITQVAAETVYVCGKLTSSAANGKQVTFVPWTPTKLVIA